MADASEASIFEALIADRPALFTESIVAESDHTIVFMDKFPIVDGHMLVIPKRTVLGMGELSAAEAADFGVMTARACASLTQTTGSPAYNMAAHVGREAGQEVMHFHLHILSRQPGDFGRNRGLFGAFRRHRNTAMVPKPAALQDDGLSEAQTELRNRLRDAFSSADSTKPQAAAAAAPAPALHSSA
jgi:diadenosine tetraphosphate (Ap4A) HIT family hydrolase